MLITLLAIAVILLSIVIIVWLTVLTMVLIKIRRVLQQVEQIAGNVAAATDWLSPAKVIHHVSKLFR